VLGGVAGLVCDVMKSRKDTINYRVNNATIHGMKEKNRSHIAGG